MKPEDNKPTKSKGEDPCKLEMEEVETMSRRAAERANMTGLKTRRRGSENEDQNKRNKKKIRKLKHAVASSDWHRAVKRCNGVKNM